MKLRHAISREARDTLFLLVLIAWVSLPHWAHVPWWCTAMSLLVIAWRGQLAITQVALPGRWAKLLVLVALLVLTFAEYGTLVGRQAGLALALGLLSLKTLELRARRDAFVLFFLGFFLVLAQFMRGQSLATALHMALAVWGLLAALVLAHIPSGQPSLWTAARLSARTAILGLPLMALLFVFFPRLPPLWGVPGQEAGGTGLSNTLEMGAMAEVALDDSIAMRLRFMGPPPDPASLYLRGPVLGHFDGKTWREADSAQTAGPTSEAAAVSAPEPLGPSLRFEAVLEPMRTRSLALPDATMSIQALISTRPLSLQSSPALGWQASEAIQQRVSVRGEAVLRYRFGTEEDPDALEGWTRLPEGHNPLLVAWARELGARSADSAEPARQRSEAILRHIRESGFSYTLAPGVYGENNPRAILDEFWMGRRAGFCEHYATAYVVAMRAMGVPARVVTGYLGTDPQAVDGWWIVRNSAAHAWAEYWAPEQGWQRVDPTAAVAPERVLRNQRLQAAPGPVIRALQGVDPTLLLRWRQAWESANHRWNQWVLGYSSAQQYDLLSQLGVESPTREDLARVLGLAACTLALLAALVLKWPRRAALSPAQILAARWRRQLQRRGLSWPQAMPPLTFAAELEATGQTEPHPQRQLAWQEAASCLRDFHQLCYAPPEATAAPPWRTLAHRFQRALRQLPLSRP